MRTKTEVPKAKISRVLEEISKLPGNPWKIITH
jgi:hypothetical protein